MTPSPLLSKLAQCISVYTYTFACYATEGIFFCGCTFGGVHVPVLTRMPEGVTVGD